MTHYSAETGVRTGWASLPPVLETAVHGAYHAQCKYLSKTNVKDVSEPPKSDRSAAAQALQEADGKDSALSEGPGAGAQRARHHVVEAA